MLSDTAATGDDLIVDFGNRRRPSEDNTGNDANVATMKTEKQVRFSEDVAVHCFQYPSREEVARRWNSEQDKDVLTQEMIRDVRSIRHVLATTPMEELEKETLYGCVGLEALVSSRVMNFLKKRKREHSRSVVDMQAYLGGERLAAYAANRSFESRERAQKLAAGYSEILSPIDGA
eukprot:scaffold2782_cov78-Skeletonema_dohrnii-CCMP3373.AAC.8